MTGFSTKITVPSGAASVVPSDTADNCTKGTRGLGCLVAGNVSVVYGGGDTAIIAVVPGGVYPGHFVRVKATDTTATGITCHY